MTSTRTDRLRAQIERLEQLSTDAAKAERAARIESLRKAQQELVDADATRKLAGATALATMKAHTVDQIATAMGYHSRQSVYGLTTSAGEGDYVFGGDVLGELAALTDRYAEAVNQRRSLVREFRALPREERLTLAEMGEVLGLSGEGVRYLTRKDPKGRPASEVGLRAR